MGFGVAIHFDVVLAVGLAAMNRREPSLSVRFARVIGGFPVTTDVLTDLRISEPVVSLQKDSCSVDVLGFAFSGFDEPLERSAFFIGKIDDVFLRSHS
jgi:hypothetical protein